MKTSPTLAESSKKVAPVIILLDLFAWVASIRMSKTKLSLTPKALAMVRLLSLMMGKPAWPEADH